MSEIENMFLRQQKGITNTNTINDNIRTNITTNLKYNRNIPLSGRNTDSDTISTPRLYYTMSLINTLPDINILSLDNNNSNDSKFTFSNTTSTINHKAYQRIIHRCRRKEKKNNIIIPQIVSHYHLILTILTVHVI